jgi:hypothetical protein
VCRRLAGETTSSTDAWKGCPTKRPGFDACEWGQSRTDRSDGYRDRGVSLGLSTSNSLEESTQIRLIDFDTDRQPVASPSQRGTMARAICATWSKPFVTPESQHLPDIVCAGTGLLTTDPQGSATLSAQGYTCLLKDRHRCHRRVPPTRRALQVTQRPYRPSRRLAAFRTVESLSTGHGSWTSSSQPSASRSVASNSVNVQG